MRNLIVLIGSVFFVTASFAQDQTKPEFAWIPEVGSQSSFQAQLGGGMLDDAGLTGSNGSPVYILARANYRVDDAASLWIELPMAGTWSSGSDDFGIGNISIGGNYRFWKGDSASLAFGTNFTFATAQTGSVIGSATRNYYSFIKDQYAISPYVQALFSGDRVYASLDAGINGQIVENAPAGFDSFEAVLFYDAGLSLAVNGPKDIWATLEFGGFSTLSYPSNDTYLYAGPGVRYQDDELSYGLHLQAPLSGPTRNEIDLLFLADVRFKF